METPYSKPDEAIDQGVRALREQSLDTSQMANVLRPQRRGSVILPVGIATAAACAIGALVLLTPSKADAGEFEKVKKAVQKQPVVYEQVFQKSKDKVWTFKAETWRDHDKRGAKVKKVDGTFEIAYDGKKTYKKEPEQATFKVVDLNVPLKTEPLMLADDVSYTVDIVFVDSSLELRKESSTINEILARDGTHFLGIQRSQKKDGRACDVYRIRVGEDTNEMLYYVDPKTDLPFLMEVLDEKGQVQGKILIEFPQEIKIDIRTREDGVYEVVPVMKGKASVDGQTVILTTEPDKPVNATIQLDDKKINP